MPQTNDQKLDVLGSFAAADGVRKVWGTKLLISDNGDMELQEAGFGTFWSRRARHSLELPAVHSQVEVVFNTALAAVQMARDRGYHDFELQKRVLYAFKGYSTLVRRGYSQGVLRAQVQRIGSNVGRAAVPLALTTRFNQSEHIPRGSQGMCYGFTIDWLRRSYKQKYGYGFGLNQTGQGETSQLVHKGKLASIAGIQENQSLIRNDGARPGLGLPGVEANMLRDVPIVSNRASAQIRQAPYANRFAGMTLHQEQSLRLREEDRRCCGIGRMGVAYEPQFLLNIFQAMELDINQANGGPCGWLISLGFADFFTGTGGAGHAIGMFFEGRTTNRYHCFDPNHGTVSGFQNVADAWLHFSILRWSLVASIPTVTINRVSTRP